MARPKGIPSYRLHKSTGKAVVTIDGKDHYLGQHGSAESKAQYNRLMADWLRNGRQLFEVTSGDGFTINNLIVAYIAYTQDHFKNSPTYLLTLKTPLRLLRLNFGDMPAASFSVPEMESLRAVMLKTPIGRKGMGHLTMCRRYVNRMAGVIREMFRWGAYRQLFPAAVHDALLKIRPLQRGRCEARETEDVTPVLAEHIEPVIKAATRPVAAILKLMLLTCARAGEISKMRMCEVDTSKPVWVYRPSKHKTAWRGHKRQILLGSEAQAIIRPFIAANAEEFLFRPIDGYVESRGTLKIPRKKFNPYYQTGCLNTAVGIACKKTKTPHWHIHQLRHTAGTMYRESHGAEVAQVLLGHKHLKMTDHYARPSVNNAINAIAARG